MGQGSSCKGKGTVTHYFGTEATMTDQQKQEFTLRIANANRTGLIVILYDMLFVYLKDVRLALAETEKDSAAVKAAVRHSDAVLKQLCDSLNFTYPIAADLYRIYTFCRKRLAQVLYQNNTQGVDDVERLLSHLYEAFQELEKTDASETLMKHTQQVYAGMTYQKATLTETFQDPEASRGFLA